MESIKQEIINNIYENGEQLITGPILQTVLLDMVDDVNDKVASASAAVPGDLVEKTGSWDDAADWVEQNSSSVVLQPDLDGYATEQWVEDQGYLKEVPEGYATTESLNDLSESVAQSIADIPEPDLSNYVTKPELNEATESVKDWVEAKHYLTTASLSGSVTEETVGFMINDATASVKDWVESQSYATEQWVEDQGYLKEHQDISGLATTESVTSLSESVAQDFANLNIPDVSGLATTESVNQLSESIAQTIEDLPQVDLNGYVTTASYNADSASFDERINAISGSDLSGYATTASLNELSESVAGDIESLNNSLDGINQGVEEVSNSLANYATTESVNQISESFAETIANIPTGSAADLSGYATTASVNQLSESIAQELETKVDDEGVYNILAGTGLAESEYGEWIVYEAAKKDELLETSSSLSASIAAISASGGVDLSGYATTESLNAVSESVSALSQSVRSLGNQVNGFGEDLDTLNGTVAGLASTSSLNSLSESVASDIDSLEGSIGDLEQDIADRVDWDTYDTERSEFSQSVASDVADLSASIAAITGSDLSGYVTTASYNADSASFDQRINSITGSGADLSGYATTASLNQVSESIQSDIEGINQSLSDLAQNIDSQIDSANPESAIYSNLQPLMQWVEDPNDPEYGVWTPVDFVTTASFESVSASFDQRINNITGSGGSGPDINLRSFLFGVEFQTLTGISGSVTNIYSNISSDTTLGFNAVPDNGNSLGITIHNTGNNSVNVTLPDTVTVGGTTYNLINNGVDNSGSMSIPSGEYGDIVVTRNGNDLFVRTSIDVSSISGSSAPVDLSGYATTASLISTTDPSNSAALFLETLKEAQWDEYRGWVIPGVVYDGEGDFGETAPAILKYLAEYDLVSIEQEYDEVTGEPSNWYVQWNIGNAEWEGHPVMNLLEFISSGSGEGNTLVEWEQLSENDGVWYSPIIRDFYGYGEDPGISASFVSTSASFDQRINNIVTGSGVDLSGYATTESVNNLSSSVGTISSSFAETIANLPTGSSGNYLPITGGTLTGNLKVDAASLGVGTNPAGNRSLAVGNGSTSTQGATYALAVGENCKTSVYGGVALGRETRVEGNGAFGTATGFRTRVEAMAGYAGGCRATASANFAFAAGFGAEAASLGQVVLGSYNVVDRSNGTGSYAVILGNGKSSTWNQDNPGDITRSNGLAIKWDGGIDINYSGSTITLQDKIAELEQGGGSPVDLSGYATTESVNILSASFDQRINNITASAGVDIVTVLTSGSTDSQVPSAKCVYDLIGEIESALIALR